jgi:DNA recombination protein RmuC|tara:strand:+ start:3859 stop:5322 length:1464 start_codon:yes stop_codon:yes gene_type:complete
LSGFNIPILWWWAAGGFLTGVVIVAAISASRIRSARRNALEAGLNREVERHSAEIDAVRERLDVRSGQLQRMEGQVAALEAQLVDARGELTTRTAELSTQRAEHAALSARLEESRKAFGEKEALFRDTSEQLKHEFEVLANRIFEQQGKTHSARLSSVLDPFKDQIVDFRKKVEQVYHTESKDRASLLTEVRNLHQASDRINQEAENLARALKGDKKLQGNWGEMVLERVLENSGLRRGHEYEVQGSKRSEDGDLKRPDVIIHLPDEKDVVVDAKVSLIAYEQALSAEDDDQRRLSITTHLSNLRTHVKQLSKQNYDQLQGVRSLDFVLMFVPIESAFMLAMEYDQRLFTDAFEARIVLVSPTTLMMTLRIIQNVWRYENQNRNAQIIAQRAGSLYDKLRVLIEEMDQLGKQLGTVERTYNSAYTKLATGRGNLARQVEQFRELGAIVKKPIDKAMLDKPAIDELSQPGSGEESTEQGAGAVPDSGK